MPPEQMGDDYEEEMSDTPATEDPAPLFLDPFEEGLGAWQADSGWEAQASTARPRSPVQATATLLPRPKAARSVS